MRGDMKKARAVWLSIWVCTALFNAGCDKVAVLALNGEWYKGDLHCHSTHSDGDSSVKDLIARAESIGLDYFVITDHDTKMGGSPSQWFDPHYQSDEMVMLYGVEWTTGLGHASVWASGPFDYEDLWQANRAEDAQMAIDAAHAKGVLFSINHPSAFLCCPWEYEAYEDTDGIEVWNATYLLPNFNNISVKDFWEKHLLSGRRIAGLGGSDTHRLKASDANVFRLAEPTTWVYAEERSAEALLAGIRAGHVAISDRPTGPRIDFVADTDGDGIFETLMGDNVVLGEETQVTLQIRIVSQDEAETAGAIEDLTSAYVAAAGGEDAYTEDELVSAFLGDGEYLLVLRRNGDLHGLWKAMEDTGRAGLTERIAPAEQAYYRVELLGRPLGDPVDAQFRGFTRSLSNPIYFNYTG